MEGSAAGGATDEPQKKAQKTEMAVGDPKLVKKASDGSKIYVEDDNDKYLVAWVSGKKVYVCKGERGENSKCEFKECKSKEDAVGFAVKLVTEMKAKGYEDGFFAGEDEDDWKAAAKKSLKMSTDEPAPPHRDMSKGWKDGDDVCKNIESLSKGGSGRPDFTARRDAMADMQSDSKAAQLATDYIRWCCPEPAQAYPEVKDLFEYTSAVAKSMLVMLLTKRSIHPSLDDEDPISSGSAALDMADNFAQPFTQFFGNVPPENIEERKEQERQRCEDIEACAKEDDPEAALEKRQFERDVAAQAAAKGKGKGKPTPPRQSYSNGLTGSLMDSFVIGIGDEAIGQFISSEDD